MEQKGIDGIMRTRHRATGHDHAIEERFETAVVKNCLGRARIQAGAANFAMGVFHHLLQANLVSHIACKSTVAIK